MFTNLSYQDKQAFFGLLDEYFASRPNLFSGNNADSSNAQQSPVAGLQALGRFLSPPPASPNGTQQNGSPTVPKTEEELLKEAKEKEAEARRVEMVTKYAQKSIKHSTAGARTGLGMVSRNATAMGALDKYGAGNLVRGAEAMVGKKTAAQGQQDTTQGQNGAASPPPDKKKGGVSGLVSGKSFGHVDTSSKMSAFTSMWKDPQKVQPPTANVNQPPAFQSSRTSLPPPTRTGSSGASPAQAQPQHQAVSAESQAQALYDYSGADAGDLTIQTGQIVNVLEKTSDDWWTCEDGNGKQGLVPANYLKEI